jgi:hypothetical protein
LAVALGVGVAVATGQGVASADAPDPSSQSASSTTDTSTETSSGTSGSTQPSTSTQTPNSAATSGITSTDSASTPSGVAVSTGGAQLSGNTVHDDDQTASEELDAEDEAVVPAASSSVQAPPSESPTRKLSARNESPPALASVSRSPVPTRPERAAAAVADRVVAAKDAAHDAADTVVHRVADAVVSMTVAEPAPVLKAAATPAEMTATEPAAPVTAPVRNMLSNVLAAFGFGSLATNTPFVPMPFPGALALLAFGARREFEQNVSSLGTTTSTSSTPVATAAFAAAPTAAVTAPATTRIGWVTGPNGVNDTARRFGIAGTDVGTMWDNGITGDNPATTIVEQREVLMAFGDTFSGPGMTGAWRMNTLFRSPDVVLSDGLFVPNGVVHDPGAYSGSPMTYPNFSREIIGNYHYGTSPEVTMIPTAGISVPGAGVNGATRQYVNFMAVKSWDSPGRWTTNYSAIAYSDDNGQNWTVVPASSVRAARWGSATVPYVAGNENFQQGAFVKPPPGSPDAAAGWVYSYGTPAGRGGTVYVSRVNQYQILDQTKYQYWNGSTWVANKPSAATPILPGTRTSGFFGWGATTTYPSVSEMSVQYNPYLKQYVMLYADQNNNVVMRTSSTPQGTWSAPKTLVTSAQYPGLYAPMIHPWSGTTQLKKADGTPEDPQYLYWNLSQWNEYNVALMRTDLSRV